MVVFWVLGYRIHKPPPMPTPSCSFGTVYWWERTFQHFLQDKSAHLKTWHGLQSVLELFKKGPGVNGFKSSFKEVVVIPDWFSTISKRSWELNRFFSGLRARIFVLVQATCATVKVVGTKKTHKHFTKCKKDAST